jgi:hypothetical protein
VVAVGPIGSVGSIGAVRDVSGVVVWSSHGDVAGEKAGLKETNRISEQVEVFKRMN